MRAYLPLLSSELPAPLPSRPLWTVSDDPTLNGEAREVAEDDAQTEAALASLTLLRDARDGNALRRLVVAVEIAGLHIGATEQTVVEIPAVEPAAMTPVAYLVDGDGMGMLVAAVLDATGQDDADEAVAALWEEAMEWYDVDEVDELAQRLRAEG
ncbi:DUF6912 family protein [Schaalia suimastitidis]|uniref:DUF6912 family protein n=1 Tax=Schaalia suimastitidis TaxID=121163 RepID=UPI0004198183|nr:hypothetical protein [Schaalia suimastitidis]